MPDYKLGYTAASRTAAVALSPDTLPGGAIDLGSFTHGDPGDSTKDLAGTHTLFHHVRDVLYKRKPNGTANGKFPENITDMAGVKIVKHGPLLTSTHFAAADLAITGTGNATAVIKAKPSDTTIANNAWTFVSSDPTKATVDAAGKVTGVAAGTVTVTATLKNGSGTCKIKVVIS